MDDPRTVITNHPWEQPITPQPRPHPGARGTHHVTLRYALTEMARYALILTTCATLAHLIAPHAHAATVVALTSPTPLAAVAWTLADDNLTTTA